MLEVQSSQELSRALQGGQNCANMSCLSVSWPIFSVPAVQAASAAEAVLCLASPRPAAIEASLQLRSR